MSVVGFDIGSESAVIAIARNNGIDIILNEASSRSTPVLVSFQGKQRHIGAAAEPLVRSNYKNTIGDMKRFLGRNYSEPSVQQELKKTHLTHKALANDEIGFLVNYNDKEEYFTPTQCLAMVFGKLKSTVEASTGAKSLNLVTSVPVYYTERQRRAVLDAAEISGLKALRLLNEPTACALGYGYPKSVKKQLDAEKPLTVMFADMGHTDFTVSIVEFYQGKMVVKGTAYDRNCGGHDIDTAIVGFLVEEFKKKTKLDCSSNPKAIMSLYRVAEKAKKTLSPYGVDTVAVNCECLYQDRDLATHLDINQFNKLCENLIPKIAATVERCLAVSQVPLSNINDVEIVGGSLRVRWAKEALAKAVNRKVDELMAHLNMDEACSRGCALQSAIISPTIRMQEFEIQDAVPYRINLQFNGILESADDATPTELEVFPRGHVSPYTVQVTFRRKKPFVIRAVYDASNKDLLAEGSNLLLGEYKIEGVPSATDSGETPRVRVSVTHDAHGCFNVTKAEWLKEVVKAAEEPTKDGDSKTPAPVKDPKEVEITENGVTKTFTAVPLTVSASKVGAISAEQMVAFQLKEGQMAAQDRELVEKDAKKNELETYVYDMRDKLSEKLKPYVTPADADAFNAKLDEVESWLYSDEGFNGTLSAYQAKLEELRKKGDPITARYFESQERPIAVSEFNNALENVKTVVNKQGIDEAYFHLSDDDWSKLRQSCKDYKSWIAEEQYKQSALPATTSSPFTAASVRAKLAEFRKAVDPILTKPKPKVEVKKEEPKKEEAKKEEVKEDQDKMDVEKNEDADVEMEDANKK